MYEYAEQHDSPEMKAHNEFIKSYTAESEQARATMSLKQLLQHQNDPDADRANMDLYLATNSIGAGDGYSGAIAAASWWKRNFFMYANIQKLAPPGERVIGIGGSGHMAILMQLLAIDSRLESIPADSYFETGHPISIQRLLQSALVCQPHRPLREPRICRTG